MALDTELIEISRESAIYALANGVEVDQLIDSMETHALEDKFSEAEGIRQGLFDWVSCKDRLNCKTYPTRDGERLDILFKEDDEDGIDDYTDFLDEE